MMKEWTKEEEAERLAKRFVDVTNRAKFARDFKIPGKGAMIYQHIGGWRPIGMDAGIAYAKAFNCTLAEISPRLYNEAMQNIGSATLQPEQIASTKQNIVETKEKQKPPSDGVDRFVFLYEHTTPLGRRVLDSALNAAEVFYLANNAMKQKDIR